MTARQRARAALVLVTSLACASAPLELETVRQEYEAAAADPEVRTRAGVELYEAQRAVEAAESAWQDQGDPLEARHRAYLADRRIQIARVAARRRALEARLENMPDERNRILREAQQRDYAEFERMLIDLGARYVPGGMVLTLADVVFDPGRDDLGSSATRNLNRMARFLSDAPNRGVVVEGHTDSRGKPEDNLRLSQERADTVRDFLASRGVAEERILAAGYGSRYPIASNDQEDGRRRNRRVEIVVLQPGVPLEPRRAGP